MPTLSVFIICMNETEMLADCLESVKWADEIIVLDSGSTDNTLDIARKYTDKVYTNTDWQGFGIQKQRAQSYATGDWVFSIDSDERVTEQLKAEIQTVIKENNQSNVYAVPRLPDVFGHFLRHGGWYPARKIRLYARSVGKYGSQRVHEKLEFNTAVQTVNLKHDLLHYTYKDLEHYLVKSAQYAAEWAIQRQQRGKKSSILKGLLHGNGCFFKIYFIKAGFLDGKYGFLIAMLSAHSTFVKYVELWLRNRKVKK